MPGPWKSFFVQGKSEDFGVNLVESYVNVGSGVWQLSLQGLYIYKPLRKQTVFLIQSKNIMGVYEAPNGTQGRIQSPLAHVQVNRDTSPIYVTIPERTFEINNVTGNRLQFSVVDLRPDPKEHEKNMYCGIHVLLRRFS